MGKKSRTSVLKRQRELKKAEKAALKQAQRSERVPETEPGPGGGQQVATQDDLAGYGLGPSEEEEEETA